MTTSLQKRKFCVSLCVFLDYCGLEQRTLSIYAFTQNIWIKVQKRKVWSDELEEEIYVGLKTKTKDSEILEDTRERKAKRVKKWMRSQLACECSAREGKCCARIMWIHCLEAPREAVWSLYREFERWTLLMSKGFREEMEWEKEMGRKNE